MTEVISKNHILAESPVYSYIDEIVYWVDIEKFKVFLYNLKTKKIKFIKVHSNPTSIFLTSKKKIIYFLTIKGLFRTNFKFIEQTHHFSFKSNYRTNDAKVISPKEIIFSIMDKNKKKLGSIYYFNLVTGQLKILLEKIKIPNSIIKKGNLLFYSDSAKGKIFKNILHKKSNQLFNKKNYKKTEPDGSVFAKKNLIFNANYKLSSIDIYNSKGYLKDQIHLPCKHPTSLCFAGKKLNKIFVTSAKVKNSRNPFNGSFFLIENSSKWTGFREKVLYV